MRIPESEVSPGTIRPVSVYYVVDYETCENEERLRAVIGEINRMRHTLISVTQDSRDIYRVFFRRCVLG